MSICDGDNERKPRIVGLVLSPRVIILPKIIKAKTRTRPAYFHDVFLFKMSMCDGDNERKPSIIRIFFKSKGITLPKLIRPEPN